MNKNQKFLIVTHNRVYGIPDALRDYLVEKKLDMVVFLAHPLDKVSGDSFMQIFRNGKKVKEIRVRRLQRLGPINFILDALLTCYWVIFKLPKLDVIIGNNNLNAFAGYLLKNLGKTKKLIYYSVDFSLDRLGNRILNKMYHWIEVFSIKNSDESWVVSDAIAIARARYLSVDRKVYSQKVVPTGVWNNVVRPLPFPKIKKHQLFFIGHLLEKQGVQKVIESILPISKQIPDIKFVVVGDGDYKEELIRLSEQLGVEKYIEFTGVIQDRHRVHQIMRESTVGVATYKPVKDKTKNFTYFGDPGKVKDYLNVGLPVIMTDVSHNAKTLEKEGCAIVVDYDEKKISKAVVKIMKSPESIKRYRENAFKIAKEFDWHRIFDNAFINNSE